jgi:hypothetical protein
VPVMPEHFCDLAEKPARIHVALPRFTRYGGDADGLSEASHCLVLTRVATSLPTGATCSASDSISFSKNESESERSARSDS